MVNIEEIKAIDPIEQQAKKLITSLVPVKKEMLSVVKNKEQYDMIGNDLIQTKKSLSDLEGLKKLIMNPIKKLKDYYDDMFDIPIKALKEDKMKFEGMMSAFRIAQENERIARERELQEQARLEEEKQKKALDKKIEKAIINGDLNKVEELKEKKEDIYIAVPVLATQDLKVEGLQIRKRWTAEVTDLMALVKAIANGQVPISAVDANMPTLNKMALVNKDTMPVPGVKFYQKEITAKE